jgi:predicted FMN-binding regulatory protein PaiB
MAMDYPIFQPTPEQVDDLLALTTLGRLVTLGTNGPEVGLLPFVCRNGSIEVHLNAKDPQIAALTANPRCSFQVDDPLSGVPSHWVDPRDARFADVLYRAVTITGTAQILGSQDELIGHIEALLAKHQPGGTHAALAATPALYDQSLGRITLVRIAEERRVAKFRLSQQEPETTRRAIVARLRERGSDRDLRTAALIETTLQS